MLPNIGVSVLDSQQISETLSAPPTVRDLSATASRENGSSQDFDSVRDKPFSPAVLNVGFLFALLLSAACFVFSAAYLQKYLNITSNAVDSIVDRTISSPASMQLGLSARLAVAKYSLSSCGVVTGLAFGFLGFALFLLGIQGTMDVRASQGEKALQLARVAPGTFVIICAALLVGISVTHKIDFDSTQQFALQAPASKAYTAPEVGNDPIP